jgi:hypothetical protein
MEMTSWDITGYRERQVPNRVFGFPESDTLVVFLPGIRYTNDAPVLYYSRSIALDSGWDVPAVDYRYGFDKRFEELPGSARDRWITEDAKAVAATINGSGGREAAAARVPRGGGG